METGSRLGAVDAVAPFDNIEIDLQNSLLGQKFFQSVRDNRLFYFAQRVFRFREIEVFGQLLGYRGSATGKTFLLPILLQRLLHLFRVEALRGKESRILARQHSAQEIARD